MRTWNQMPKLTLDKRLAFCRKLNMSICLAQAVLALIAITRWLHINNINGFRYLGYSVTCALLQAQLVVIVAPYVPLYKTNVLGVMLITFCCMIGGWIGGLYSGPLWVEGTLETFMRSGNFADILWTTKGYLILTTFVCLGVIIAIQIPFLFLLYVYNGGMKPNQDLPALYPWLLLLVELTWPLFGLWWVLSNEGMSIIHTTKLNTIGFCMLNIISKGGFTLTMLALTKRHKAMWPEQNGPTLTTRHDESKYTAPEDLWIVKQLRPYDQDQKDEGDDSDLELEAGNANEENYSFGLPVARSQSHDFPQGAPCQECDAHVSPALQDHMDQIQESLPPRAEIQEGVDQEQDQEMAHPTIPAKITLQPEPTDPMTASQKSLASAVPAIAATAWRTPANPIATAATPTIVIEGEEEQSQQLCALTCSY
eukprot:TRINITY_DN6242_c0_g1_i1.p1 TRINITY_DN6242_c0_g1~~TRINITY_DN6242_c0_g1_i1.p1  ORF type:complete len:424 (+),score=59.56 TRINITY_DN6242_c0_g1_i1:794-2065(+)